jgi:hypothetical protein
MVISGQSYESAEEASVSLYDEWRADIAEDRPELLDDTTDAALWWLTDRVEHPAELEWLVPAFVNEHIARQWQTARYSVLMAARKVGR